MAALIAEIMGMSIEIETQQERLRPPGSEVDRLWADNTLARQLLGWAPEFQGREGLKHGLAATVRWFCDPANIARYKADRYNV